MRPGRVPSTARRWTPDVEVERLGDGGWDALHAFEASLGPEWTPREETVRWLHRRHPDASSRLPPVWVAKKGGLVVGRQAAIPLTLRVGGSDVPAFWAIDLLVDPAWRLKGVGPLLVDTLAAERPVVLALGMTEPAYRSYRRAGWLDLGFVPRWVRPLRPARLAERRLGRRESGPVTPVVDRAAGWADRGLAAVERSRGYRLERFDHFGPEVETVVERASRNDGVRSRRDLAFLRWRFDDGPDAAGCARFYLRRRGERVGYAVTRGGVGPHGPLLEILDCVIAPGDLAAFLRLLVASDEARGAQAVHCTMIDRLARAALRFAGFVPRVPDLRLMVHLRSDARDLEPLVGDPDRWLVTMADGDNRITR